MCVLFWGFFGGSYYCWKGAEVSFLKPFASVMNLPAGYE